MQSSHKKAKNGNTYTLATDLEVEFDLPNRKQYCKPISINVIDRDLTLEYSLRQDSFQGLIFGVKIYNDTYVKSQNWSKLHESLG